MKSHAKYFTAIVCCAAIMVFSLSLPVVYGKRVDSSTFGRVSELETEESLGPLAYKDTNDRISGLLETVSKAEALGISARPVYSVDAEDMSEESKTKMIEQITALCDASIIPDLTIYDIYDDLSFSEYYNLYTPENTLSLMILYLEGDSYSAAFLIDPEIYCIYYCGVEFFSDEVPAMPKADNDYFERVSEYYAPDSFSVEYITPDTSCSNLIFGNNHTLFGVYSGRDYFSCGINSIYVTMQYYGDYIPSGLATDAYSYDEYSKLYDTEMVKIASGN